MAHASAFPSPIRRPDHLQAGIISRICLENFMCHSSLEIELGPRVNFITGQNGSGKSAILTALCVAFGSRARSTQRAHTLKDFIKNGCSYSLVRVEIQNQGDEAFKPELYGTVIILERRVSGSSNAIALKSSQGRIVGSKKKDLLEIVDHFNIDVDNPCVIMSQDKSREFLHSGNSKDKFKFYFKATLLEKLLDLLNGIENQLQEATAQVNQFEEALKPMVNELHELDEKIGSMEYVEEISNELQLIRNKLAWAIVYDAEKKLEEERKVVEELKKRIRKCQGRIDEQNQKMEELNNRFAEKKCEIDNMMNKTSEVNRKKEELEESYSMALKEKIELETAVERKAKQIEERDRQVKLLKRQIDDLRKDLQAEENEVEEKLRQLQAEIDEVSVICRRSKEEEEGIIEKIADVTNEIKQIARQIEDVERSLLEISNNIGKLQMTQTNKVTAFGGNQVIRLLQTIERRRDRFRSPPIGPIGAHLKLENESVWSNAVENAIGWLLEAFIVTDYSDFRALRECAWEANYRRLKIIIYDFSWPRLVMPRDMLPHTNHPTTFSLLHSDNHVVLNVLVDVGSAERQVLVKNYEIGKTIAFDEKIPNVKEVYTSDGCKLFTKRSAQTTLPPFKNRNAGRLSGSFDRQIKNLEKEALEANELAQECRGKKRSREEELKNLRDMLASVKRKRMEEERVLSLREFELQDAKKSLSCSPPAYNVGGLREEMSRLQDEIRVEKTLQEKIHGKVNESSTKAENLLFSFKSFCESAKLDISGFDEAEKELMVIEKELDEAEDKKKHYEGVLNSKVLPGLKESEAEVQKLEHECKENRQKASVICPESEVEETLQGCKESNPEKLSARFTTLKRRLQHESQRFSESIDDLRISYEEKKRKVSRKQQIYKSFREKLEACDKSLGLRWSKLGNSATEMKKRLQWSFSGNLKKKGVWGKAEVSYKDETLLIEVTTPHDGSNSKKGSDTRGLSGGERSFSTLCFTLALHEMVEAPFRAMDEFDVFMDAVSRKISLDTMVDFALEQGSQWIFITPHDISMVKDDERIKKQQLAAPRG